MSHIDPRGSGKRVVADLVTLAKDTGTFIADVARIAYVKIRSFAEKSEKDKNSDGDGEKTRGRVED